MSGVPRGNPSVRVLYIAGAGRSGSTIVDNILGQMPGYVSAGEVTYFWQRLILEGRRCGCGEVGMACPVWSEVLSSMGNPGQADATRMVAAARSALRIRNVPSMVAPGGTARLRSQLGNEYLSRLAELYQAIAMVTGSATIVDSSKFPGYGYAVSSLVDIDVDVIHMVRDARAVAYSWLRQKAQPDTDARVNMMQRRVTTVAPRWVSANVATEALFKREPQSYTRLRYEDFVNDPRGILDGALVDVGLDPLPDGIVDDRHALLKPSHTISGNPSRFSTGAVELRMDDEWKSKLSRRDSKIVTSLTFPLLARYGYVARWG